MDAIKEDGAWFDFFYVEIMTGLHRGEICGLRWEDFDEADGTLKVCRTVRRDKGMGLTTGDTKTFAGARKSMLLQCHGNTQGTEADIADRLDISKSALPGATDRSGCGLS